MLDLYHVLRHAVYGILYIGGFDFMSFCAFRLAVCDFSSQCHTVNIAGIYSSYLGEGREMWWDV